MTDRLVATRFGAWLNGCVFCQAYREPEAVAAGVADELLGQVALWGSSPAFTPAERAALEFTERFCQDSLSIDDALFAKLHEHFDDRTIVILTAAIGKYLAWGRFAQVLGLEQACAISDPSSARAVSSAS